jgi:hypothetical protein
MGLARVLADFDRAAVASIRLDLAAAFPALGSRAAVLAPQAAGSAADLVAAAGREAEASEEVDKVAEDLIAAVGAEVREQGAEQTRRQL